MSIHKSLVARGRLKRHRNVLSRTERLAALEQEEKWTAEDGSVFNLPKVRVAKLKRATKKKEAKEGEEAGAATAGTAAGPVAKAPASAPKAAAKDSKPAKK